MLRFLLYFQILVAVTIWPASALPGRKSTSVSPPITPGATTTATISDAAAAPTQSIIIAEIGSDEWIADGKTKWLTYLVSDDQVPDWCNGANSTRTVTNANDDADLPNLYYGTRYGDPSSLDGCSYDSNAKTWGCDGWSASCQDQFGKDKLGFPVYGALVTTCDGLDVTELTICVKDAASSSATQTIKAPSSTAAAKATWSALCEEGGRTNQAWNDSKMDDFLDDLAQNIPEGNTGTFVELIESKVTGISQFSCGFNLEGDQACEVNLVHCDASRARYFYVLYAIQTWHNWVNEVIAAFAWTRTQFGGQAGALVNDFLPTKLPTSDTWVLTLMAGLLGALSGGFAMAIELLPGIASEALLISGAAGVSGGGDTMANGIVTGQLPSAEAVVQNELNSLADVETYVIAQINSTIESINNTATQVLTDPATNDPTNNYYYMSANNSIASILHGGAFASSSVGTGEDLSMYQTAVSRMWDASISFLWQSQNVIIVKLSTDIIGLTGPPCDIQLTEGFQRTCEGNTAYFFGIIGTTYSDTTPIYGADDKILGKYGLNMLGVAKAANATQVKYGFGKYFSSATAQQIMSNAFQSPDELIMTIPFCDLDALYDRWKDTSLVNLENIITKEVTSP
ncbi:hypothetical protein N7510_008809 [Penicillium lagena]|uniref:uncharacterized protein n=1 Tax=Penicillium lagena TaxID=94218 RepID=UPI00254202DD|nr:uncharacterized protein N7510_008809 [Penicillium lagena]KAJ5606028.1 hypothetical protein N7510_008809 [Penicillium lagena]